MTIGFRRSLSRATLGLAVVALAVGCNGGENGSDGSAGHGDGPSSDHVDTSTPVVGDALVTGSIGDASVLIPMLAGDSASHSITGMIFDGLVAYDNTLSHLEPRLAEKWEISGDGLEITFHLRRNVKWQDGEPFTARDVEFGFSTITNPETLTAYAEDFLQVDTFEVIDDYTFKVTYEKPFASALASWGNMVVLPRHLLEGKPINDHAQAFGRNPVGLGEYKFDSWETQKKIVVEVNDDYYRGRPHIDRVVTRVIPDQQTQFLELKSGGLDEMGLTPTQYSRQTSSKEFEKNFAKYKYLTNSYTYLGYNLLKPLFQDKRVREALGHAIDKQEIVDVVLLGLGQPAHVPYKPGTKWANESLKGPAFDPDKAKALFAEAGWTDSDGDGVLDRDGERFEFELITNKGNEQREKAATIIQRRLTEVGVKVNVKVIEWAAFINNFIDTKNFDAVVLGWSLSPDPDQYDIWHSSKTKPKQFNFVSFANDEVDEILEKGRRTFDEDERKKYYDRFQEILNEEQPYTFLYVAYALPIVHKRFHGIESPPAGIHYNFKDWFVPKPLQKYALADAP